MFQKNLYIFFIVILSFQVFDLLAQGDTLELQSTKIKQGKWSNLPYFMDDIMIIGGLNSSGIYWSNNFRELSYAGGFQLGVEGIMPIGNITFVDFGFQYAQRNFIHDVNSIKFTNHFLDFPVYVSFALPELRRIDWRFFLGTQLSYRLNSTQSGDYITIDPDFFQYDISRFKRFDLGMTFGLSGEVKDIYFRLRSFVGVNNLDNLEQGAMNSFYIEMGHFLFRKYRK
jgi:hypothetical protein